jgi:methyltransferase (TIGR00027 family)
MENSVSLTAFYTCGIRMLDAASAAPIVGDQYARHFMSDEGFAILDRFRSLRRPNAGNLTRHRIIDDYLQAALEADPATNVVLIGAGFDSRAFRLRGGRWTEIDEPAIIEHKEARLPAAKCANALKRISVRFGKESLQEKLASLGDANPVIVVIEGVLLYLDAAQIRDLTKTLRQVFPRHVLICDLVAPRFVRRYSQRLHNLIRSLGPSFSNFSEEPQAFVASTGYRLTHRVSVIERAVALGSMRIPRFVLRLLRSLVEGYSVCVFQPETVQAG